VRQFSDQKVKGQNSGGWPHHKNVRKYKANYFFSTNYLSLLPANGVVEQRVKVLTPGLAGGSCTNHVLQ